MPERFYNRTMVAVLLTMIGLCSSRCLAEDADKGGFDYSAYAAVLKAFVNEKAMVNYSELKAQPHPLEAFVSDVGTLDRSRYEKWSKKNKIAFWLNAYNGLTLKVIIDNYPIKASFLRSRIYPGNSIRQISGVWDKITFDVMGRNLTLDHIEHKILRVEFNEPRIHMALVCAAMGCPPLRNEPYTGAKLDEQLDDQTRRFLANPIKFKIDRNRDAVYLSPIFKWFAEDFVEKYGPQTNIGKHNKTESAVLNFIAPYLSGVDKKYVLAGKYRIKYLKYDWSLNEQPTKK